MTKPRFTKEQLRILRELDVDTALKIVAKKGFIPDRRENAIAGLHKARIEVGAPTFSEAELKVSRDWLIANDYEVPDV